MSNLLEQLKATSQHRILTVSRRADTLVIAPAGDPRGFSRTLYDAEFNRISDLLAAPEIRNAIVDLSQSPYLGADIIGSFFSWQEKLAPKGQLALAAPSNDMLITLKSRELSESMPIYDTVNEAVKKVSNESWIQRIRDNPIIFGSALGIALLILGWQITVQTAFLAPIVGSSESRLYNKLIYHWDELESLREIKADHRLWKLFAQEVDDSLMPSIKELRKRKRDECEDATFKATQAFWQMTRSGAPSPTGEETFMKNVADAQRVIKLQQGIELPLPQRASSTAPAKPEPKSDSAN